MKVGTDGVLIGAWAAHPDPKTILDIGCGNGLVAMMLAQRYPTAKITAIEIEESACRQAAINFELSTWNERLNLIHNDFLKFASATSLQFDLIVSNPPFFSNSLKSHDETKNLARHDERLPLAELLACSSQILSPHGSLSLILPFSEKTQLVSHLDKSGLKLMNFTTVLPKPGKKAHRILIRAGFENNSFIEDMIEIETGERHEYSDRFKQLVEEFYL